MCNRTPGLGRPGTINILERTDIIKIARRIEEKWL